MMSLEMPLDGETGMRLVREALEGLIEPKIVSAVIFEALAASEAKKLPTDAESFRAFARGPLAKVAEKRVGASAATNIVARLEAVFSSASTVAEVTREAPNTLEVPILQGPVRVLVISRSSTLAIGLRAALGGDVVAVGTAADVIAAAKMANRIEPELLVIDATAPVSEDHDELVSIVKNVSSTTARLIWGYEHQWGRGLARGLDNARLTFTPIDRSAGVEPLLDLVRSRSRT